MRDADLTLELWTKLSKDWPSHERLLSRHTREIAWDGIPIDVKALDEAIPILESRNWEAGTKLPWYHGGDEKPLSPKALAEECRKAGIEPPPSLAKDSEDCAAWEDKYGGTYPWVAAMREYRRTNTLLERLRAMRARVTPGGDMNYGLLYFGASVTGRWSGADGVNVQNLPKEPMFGVDFRSMLKAPPGYKFINVDLSQIEPRCLAWLVGNEPMLQKLRDGMAIYEAHARTSMGWTGGKLKHEDTLLYALAKARVLSLGYGAGAEKFVIMAANYGIKLNLSEAEDVVKAFRASEPLVCGRNGLWNQLQRGMTLAAAKKEDYHVELPSGRLLRYMRPSTLGGLTAETVSKGGIIRKKWWGGSLTENLVQATARDVFAVSIPIIEYELGLPILFHVHDELTCLAKENKAEDALRDILQVMRTPPTFMPGLPLDAEGKIVDTYPNK
jgi:DNA polymerase